MFNARGTYDTTALMNAAFNRKVPAISALLQAGADLDARDSNGMTSLMLAAQGITKAPDDNYEAITVLLKAGTDINAQSGARLYCSDLGSHADQEP